MENSPNEMRELRRLLRDLVALATTPAGWVGRNRAQIAESVADIVLHTLRADAVYVCLQSPEQIQVVRSPQHPRFDDEIRRVWPESAASLRVETITASNWPTALRVAVQPIGISNDNGFIAVGCSGSQFPTEAESLLLSVVANQTAVALQTAKLRTEAELERFRLRDLIAQAPAAIGLLTGPEHRWVYVNDNYVRVTGRTSASEFVGKTLRESLPEIERQPFLQLLDDVYRTGKPYFGREMKATLNRAHTGQPEDAYFDFVYQPLVNSQGVVDGILVHAVEVTDKVTARSAIERLAAIVESSDDAIVSKDLNGIVTSWNPAAEKIFGYAAREMIGRSITTIIPPELQDDEERILATIAHGKRIEHFETVRVTKAGERLEVSLTISPVRDVTGKIVGAAKIARDITQQKKTERALHTTERLAAVGRLAATIAHEINNPLAAVTNFVYLAKQRVVRDDVREFLAGAQEELKRISHLTKQTLGFYRESQGARCVTIGSTLDSLISVFSYKTRDRAIEISPEIRKDPEIYAVPGEIRQLVANLLSNSIDAVGPAGKIRIRVSGSSSFNGSQEGGVKLTIADSGRGIPLQARAKLFEPFFTTKKDIGTGLGLWISKNIVEKHHGWIRMKTSTVPGRSWTVFSVFLPANPQPVPTVNVESGVLGAV
jgi:PAS domain S-box-containing protein